MPTPGATPGSSPGPYPGPLPLSFTPADAEHGPTVCVIAELGVNHNGSVAQARSLIEAAAGAGADAVKFQLFDPRTLLSNQARLAAYQAAAGATDPLAMLDQLQLRLADMQALAQVAHEAHLAFVVTPFSLQDIPRLRQLPLLSAVKIASPDAVNEPLLTQALGLGLPLLVSTGTCELEELVWVARLLSSAPGAGRGLPGVAGGALLQCVSSYPTPASEAALGGIISLSQRFGLPVGYSDHTTELTTGALAVAAGACVIEKHLTLDRHATGPDHAASLDPVSFTHYVDLVRQAQAMLGPLHKHCLPLEREVREVSRQSLCAARDLPAGHVLTESDLTVRRPGTGLPARAWAATVGKRLTTALRAGDMLTPGHLDCV